MKKILKSALFVIVVTIVIASAIILAIIGLPKEYSDNPIIFLAILPITAIVAIATLREALPELSRLFQKEQTEKSKRKRLLDQIKDNWIKPFLHSQLDKDDPFDISLEVKPSAILHGDNFKDFKDKLPDVSSQIKSLYDSARGQLLILGAPGSGKTFLLVQLAELLVQQADDDETKPIPVIFNLSSWSKDEPDLEDWIQHELKRIYGVPKTQAENWIENNQLIFLLDGLDEVAQPQDDPPAEKEKAQTIRQNCVNKINAFRDKYHQEFDFIIPIVVCSRIEEYHQVSYLLGLHGAIELQPLTKTQIEQIITPEQYPALWEIYAQEKRVQAYAQTPFMLQLMRYTYQGKSEVELALNQGEHRTAHIYKHYLEKRFQQNPSSTYTRIKTQTYLDWLAYQLIRHDETIFYIEHLQPTWIDNPHIQKYYPWIFGLIFGLSGGLIFGLIVGQIGGLSDGLRVGLGVGLGVGLRVGKSNITITDQLSYRLDKERLIVGLIGGLIGGLIFGQIFGQIVGQIVGLIGGLIVGLIVGLIGGLSDGLRPSSNIRLRQKPNDGIRLSLINGVIVGLIFGLIVGLIFGLIVGLIFGVIVGVIVGLIFGLIGGLIFGLSGGLDAVIMHLVLRHLLYFSDHIPYNYADFLDYTVSAGFMRRIGTGYAFRHDYLRRHFANRWKEKHPSTPND